mgnify:CR=1 FL=1
MLRYWYAYSLEEIGRMQGMRKDAVATSLYRTREKLKEFLELKAKLDLLANEIKLSDGSLADEMYIRKLQFCSSKVTNFEEKLENKCGEADRVKHTTDK